MAIERRTDLALEARELYHERENTPDLPEGVEEEHFTAAGFPVTRVRVTNENGSKMLCKPIGSYTTIELDRLLRREDRAFSDCAGVIATELRELCHLGEGDSVLVAGLGNSSITPDAVGHIAVQYTIVTRHLKDTYPGEFAHFRAVSAVEPGVLGTTGIESADLVASVVQKVRPAAVIAVDALASRRLSRVCRTVQLTNTGISPGSGVGNSRRELSSATLGIPVIAVGVPTVVDAATLAADLAETAGTALDEEALRRESGGMIVTPRDIDTSVNDISRLVAYAINLAFHDGLTVEDVDMFVG